MSDLLTAEKLANRLKVKAATIQTWARQVGFLASN